MTDRMDVVAPRQGKDGKTYYSRLGIAFATKNGGWSISLEALPLPSLNDRGVLETRLLLMPPRDDARPAAAPTSARRAPVEDGDDIPF